jgi:hypothetical protein
MSLQVLRQLWKTRLDMIIGADSVDELEIMATDHLKESNRARVAVQRLARTVHAETRSAVLALRIGEEPDSTDNSDMSDTNE